MGYELTGITFEIIYNVFLACVKNKDAEIDAYVLIGQSGLTSA